ncbi:MAG: hypothetical protein BYD32DRAFT_437970 [Podila humilis]|nr:MAG: hypothetical protein BYD32DRAFT_437970 [Podila humilis]
MAEPFDGSTSHARRPLHQDNDNPHAHDQHQDQYPNPFQQPPGQHTSSQQQHYSILIPTVNHWPRIALEGLARGAVHALDALKYAQRTLHAHLAALDPSVRGADPPCPAHHAAGVASTHEPIPVAGRVGPVLQPRGAGQDCPAVRTPGVRVGREGYGDEGDGVWV